MRTSNDVVVVLPCVPATAIVGRWEQMAAKISARLSTMVPVDRAATISILCCGIALEAVT
ncbi:unannotated protein [freshwater metagenome]|uniref:Unannotated protein n=1 Tax=freshwater metagenome TaxID=449393 RepID=A0A6J6BCZ7_9ZZZZ